MKPNNTHTHNFDIARLSLSSFLAAYKAQLRKTKFDQIVRNNRFCVMTQLSKTLCYCNKTSTDILSSLCPMSNFQPHKKNIMTTEFPLKVTPPPIQSTTWPTSRTAGPILTLIFLMLPPPKTASVINC